MRVSLKWLSDYVAVPKDTKAFCDKLDLTGTGVEGVESVGESLEGVVVGYVKTCELHPDSDHMHVVTVDTGAAEPVQIVCGAPNIAAGIEGARGLRGGGAARRLRHQEEQAARRCQLRHVLQQARAGLRRRPFRHLGASPRMLPWAWPSRSTWARATRCWTWRSRRTARTACPWWAWPARWGPCTRRMRKARLRPWRVRSTG